MIILQHIPAIISALLLAAHFLRGGHLVMTLICLAMPLLLISPTKARIRLYQTFLILSALVWIFAAADIALDRIAAGMPWIRMAIILGIVTILNIAAALLFETKRMRARYRAPNNEPSVGREDVTLETPDQKK